MEIPEDRTGADVLLMFLGRAGLAFVCCTYISLSGIPQTEVCEVYMYVCVHEHIDTEINILLCAHSNRNGFQPLANTPSCGSASYLRQQITTCISVSRAQQDRALESSVGQPPLGGKRLPGVGTSRERNSGGSARSIQSRRHLSL